MINYKYAGSLKNQRSKCGLFGPEASENSLPRETEGGDTVQHRTAVTLKGSALLKYRFLLRRFGVGPWNQHFHKAPW